MHGKTTSQKIKAAAHLLNTAAKGATQVQAKRIALRHNGSGQELVQAQDSFHRATIAAAQATTEAIQTALEYLDDENP